MRLRGSKSVLGGLCMGLMVLLFCSWSSVAQAAKPTVGLQITPLRNYPTLDPGATSDSSIMLTNRTHTTQTVSLSVEVFGVTDEAYDYDFIPSSTTQWVQLVDKQITLQVNQSQAVAYSIAVPANATPGDHFFILLASLQPTLSPTHINEISRVASLVYLQVNGQLSRQSRLLSASVPWFSAHNTIPLVTQVADSGNTYIRARIGVFATHEPFGRSESLEQLNNLILPSTVRRVSGTLTLPGIPGLYKVSTQYASPTGTPMTINHYVLYCPTWLQVLILVSCVGGGLFFWRRLHRSPRPPQ
jgi:hypothetical protein